MERNRTSALCKECSLVGNTLVPPSGNSDRPLYAFVGEAPGETEEEEGRPFVGKAGSFLRMFLKDVGIDDTDCYFTNTIQCRPPGNKKPTAKQVTCCLPRLCDELARVKPKYIITLGGIATTALLDLNRGITRCHGVYREIEFSNGHRAGVMPTYHPSGVIRGPEFYPDFAEEIIRVTEIAQGAPAVVLPDESKYGVIQTQAHFNWLIRQLKSVRTRVSCDIETDTMNWFTCRILCMGLSWERETAYTIDWPKLMEGNLRNIRALDAVLADISLSFQNGMYDVPILKNYGFKHIRYEYDTLFGHYLLDERQGTHGLERLAIRYYHAEDYKTQFREAIGLKAGFVEDGAFGEAILKCYQEDPNRLFMYNCKDTDYTKRLTDDQIPQLEEQGQMAILEGIEMVSAKMFSEFTNNGMLIDREYWMTMVRGWVKEMDELEVEMRKFPGAENLLLTSSKALAKYLYDELKLLPFGGEESFGLKKISEDAISTAIRSVEDPEAIEYWTSKRTQMSEGLKGFGGEAKGITPRSTSTYMLYYLKQQHPFPGYLIKWKTLRKRFGMYYTGLKKNMWPDGRVRPQYDMTATRTGRKASNKPAIHNLPRGDEIYNIFIADIGWVDIHADYITAEMRMMAHYSGCKDLKRVLATEDIHTRMAKEIFDITDEAWDALDKTTQKNMRIASKMITFGIPYGRSAAGLAPQLHITVDEAETYLQKYFDKFPGLFAWLNWQRAQGVKNKVVISAMGRRRRFPFIRDKYHRKEVERQAGNMAIQSAINDLTLVAQARAIEALREAGIPAKPWPHIHDSLNILVPINLWRMAVPIIAHAMEDNLPFETTMAFPAEIEVGARWGDMKTVYRGIQYKGEEELEFPPLNEPKEG